MVASKIIPKLVLLFFRFHSEEEAVEGEVGEEVVSFLLHPLASSSVCKSLDPLQSFSTNHSLYEKLEHHPLSFRHNILIHCCSGY